MTDVSVRITAKDETGAPIDAAKKNLASLASTGETSAKQLNAAMRGVPAQFTDIVTSLQGGQAPLTVLLQQGGQLKDMFGGIGPAAASLSKYMLGLITPTTILAGAVAAIGYAYLQATRENDAYAKAIIMTGNAAGTTSGQLRDMAAGIADTSNHTRGAAAAALVELVGTAGIAREKLQDFAALALELDSKAGIPVEKTAKAFEQLGKEPLKAAVELNQATRFLTMSAYEQIKALEDQGKVAQAGAVAQQAYADAMTDRTKALSQNLGVLERSWSGVAGAAKNAWDFMLGVGRSNDLEQKIAIAQKTIAELESKNGGGFHKNRSQDLLDAQSELANLLEVQKLQQKQLGIDKERSDLLLARIRWNKDGESFETNSVKMAKEIAKAENEGALAGVSRLEIEKRIADIREKYTDKSMINAGRDRELASIKQFASEQINIYKDSEKMVDSLRAAGLLSESEYYNAKRGFINLNRELQVQAIDDEINVIKKQVTVGKDRIDNDRKIIELEGQKAKVIADSAFATGESDLRQAASLETVRRAYQEARMAAQEYLDATKRGYDRELSVQDRGDAERKRIEGQIQITEKYAKQRLDLERKMMLEKDQSPENRQKYEDQLALLKEFEDKAIKEWGSYYDRVLEQDRRWETGVRRSTENYFAEAMSSAKQYGAVTEKVFRGMEDAVVEYTKTGQLSVTSLANSIISDLVRIQIQQGLTGPMAKYFGSMFGSGSVNMGTATAADMDIFYAANGGVMSASGSLPLHTYSAGGVASSPQLAVFGEGRMNEAYVPLPDGRSIPVTMNSGAGSNVVVNIHNIEGQTASVEQKRGADGSFSVDVMIRQIEGAMADGVAGRTGSLYQSINANFMAKSTV